MLVCPLANHSHAMMNTGKKRRRGRPSTYPESEGRPIKRVRRSKRQRGVAMDLHSPNGDDKAIQLDREKSLSTLESPPISPLSSESGVASATSMHSDDSSEPVDTSLSHRHSECNCDTEKQCLPNSSCDIPPPCHEATPRMHLGRQTALEVIQQQSGSKQSMIRNPAEGPTLLRGKRMASLNASACVSAIIESQKRPQKAKESKPNSSTECSAFCVLPSISTEVDDGQSQQAVVLHLQQPLETTCTIVPPLKTDEREWCSTTSGISLSLADYLQLATQSGLCPEETDDPDADVYNSKGLLYNGGTVHPYTRFFLTSEGLVPSRIFPFAVPSSYQAVISFVNQQEKPQPQRRGSCKRDKWRAIGKPIKTIEYFKEDSMSKVKRQYFIGIQRKHEDVYVRDCIVVRSGRRRQDKPYIAKVASLWKETGELMMTVFWYYRPEDTDGTNLDDFQQDELLASQHHDDNSVACIEDKCSVLGLREYCRYRAHVGKLDKKPNCSRESGVPKDYIFLCYRGYNHISCKVYRGSKI